MSESHFHLIFVGGGLSSSLAAIRLQETRPEVKFVVLEAQDKTVVPQTLSLQGIPDDSATLCSPGTSWLDPWFSAQWSQYEVRFPNLQRVIASSYYSIRAADFFPKVQARLADAYRPRHMVRRVAPHSVHLEDGRTFTADLVIDTRTKEAIQPICAYQKFVGLNVRTASPHGLKHPILMDARVEQLDGYRFFYVLPWSENELLIEDTRYSDTPHLDEDAYRRHILSYATRCGWLVEAVHESEKGVLPIPFYGCPQPERDGGIGLGVGAGLFHPTTGYSIYEAIRSAELLASLPILTRQDVADALHRWGRKRWDDQEFYRRLNNMMFFATTGGERYRVLEHFYRCEDDVLSRFYGGVTSAADKLQILSGKPPVPICRGLYHFFHKKEARHENV